MLCFQIVTRGTLSVSLQAPQKQGLGIPLFGLPCSTELNVYHLPNVIEVYFMNSTEGNTVLQTTPLLLPPPCLMP